MAKRVRIHNFTFFIGVLLTIQVARAGTINAILVSPELSGSLGDTVEFDGTLTNSTGSDLWINSAGITLSGFDSNDSDLTEFILNVSGPLSANALVGPTAFFDISIPNIFPDGQYGGLLTIQGGSSPFDDGVLQSVPFVVDVTSVPEPRSVILVLMCYVLALLHWRFKRRHT